MNLLSVSFGVFFWTFVTIFLVLLILRVFAYNIIVKSLENRKKVIESSITNSVEIENKLKAISDHEKDLELEIERKRRELLDNLELYRKEMMQKISLEEEAERLKMHKRIKEEETEIYSKFEKECYNKASVMALNLAKRLLIRGTENVDKQNDFIDSLVTELSVVNK